MWIIHAVLVHLAILGSIFVIYFRSPVISGLSPQKNLQNPPADRLVLIVLDGLRAESFFNNKCEDVPHILQLIREGGLVGISRTRVPTESRPGHIALIAGLYEDPSAVLRGWKTNPIDFDNVFNRSAHTYAWGAMDVLHIFSKITGEDRLMIDAYNEYDFTGKDTPFLVDQWVFDRVNRFLDRKSADLRKQKRVVFFLHLLALDTSGHIHKPGSKLFLQTLHNTEKGVYDIYRRFEETFPDGKTAYVLTSDHGMTNHGSHGAGDDLETQTPFVVWGAGVNSWHSTPDTGERIEIDDSSSVPLASMQQAQMTPLMSALVGLAPPVNNFGMLPPLILNVSAEYDAYATYTNALQIIGQFESLLNAFNRGYLSQFLYTYEHLDANSIQVFREHSEINFQSKDFDIITTQSYYFMSKALNGIDYFLNYYQRVLLMCTSVTFVLWMLYMIASLSEKSMKPVSPVRDFRGPKVVALLLTVFCIAQRVPLEVSFYMFLPVVLWVLCLHSFSGKNQFVSSLRLLKPQLVIVVVTAAILMVCSFFQEKCISLVFLLFCAFKFMELREQGLKFYLWCFLTAALSVFPLLPRVVGSRNDLLLLLGAVLTLARAVLVKSGVSKKMLLIAIIGLSNAAFCVFKHNNHEAAPFACRIISWLFLLRCLVVPFWSAPSSSKAQVERVFFYLCTAYLLLSTSYEAIFVVLLGSQLLLTFSQSKRSPVNYLDFGGNDLMESFQQALAILIYTLFAIFGSGNTASVSSFDPNVMRCFITTFSPWIIMVLVVLKIFLPVLLNIVIIYGTLGPALNERKVFIAMLFICDLMGLILLYFVKNQGSWLEIGSSISRFVIMSVMTLILVGTTYIVKLYLRMSKSTESVHGMEKIK